MKKEKLLSLFFGSLSGLAFAPLYFFPFLFGISFLCSKNASAKGFSESAVLGLLFGFGHFCVSMYWISIGVGVYIGDFWWFLPFSFLGLPALLGSFVASTCVCSYKFREKKYYSFIFCIFWVFFEWLRSWIFTGLPWNLLGYSLSFSDYLIQPASLFGIYGLSFAVVYISVSLTGTDRKIKILSSAILLSSFALFGSDSLKKSPKEFLPITARLVQPSIEQRAKWDENLFLSNLRKHMELSNAPGVEKIDLVIWSESALTVPYGYAASFLRPFLETGFTLLFGSVSENREKGEIYTGLSGIDYGGEIFEYRKKHLVPFGEYVPFKNFLPVKKIAGGYTDYTPGKGDGIVYLKKFGLKLKPLVCYESIFPAEVRTKVGEADLFVNVTNDAWYGRSFGPYQHFEISRIRAVENGIPELRVAGNGISAVIDSKGSVIKQLPLNEVGILDSPLPKKLSSPTLYSLIGDIGCLAVALLALLIEILVGYFFKKYRFFRF